MSFQQDCSLVSDVKIMEANVVNNIVDVKWNDGGRSLYPLIYLRDICSCSSCCHPDFHQRISDVLVTCKLDYGPTAVNVTQDGKTLEINWSDGHISKFDSQWLCDGELRDDSDETVSNRLVKKGRITWGSEMSMNLPTVEYQHVVTSDLELLKMLDYLVCYGFAVVENGPGKENNVTEIADRVGHTMRTFAGNPWKVPSPLSNQRLYNTTADLSFHNDMHFAQNVPGIQFFHCLKQATSGGESRLVDGFYVASELNRTDPEAFRVLTDCFVANHDDDTDCGGEYIMRPRKRTIELDYDGTIKHVLLHETSRDFWHTTTVKNTESFIRAYGKLTELIRDPRFSIEFILYPGEMTVFDNHRLMHSRRGYPKHEERIFEGTYMEWDTTYSRMRVLARKLGVPMNPNF